MADWLRGFQRRDLGPDGGRYDTRRNPKVLLHTTEGSTLGAAENAYDRYPPHFGVDPDRKIRRQYVRLDRHSYSLAGGEADDEYVIQVEIVGFAGQTHRWSDDKLEWLGTHVLRPIMDAIDCPGRIPSVGFKGEGAGFILASPSSPIRFSLAEFRRFSGVCGHQHAPSPDSHWDPGALNVQKIIDYAEEDMPSAEEIARAVWTWDGDDRGIPLPESGFSDGYRQRNPRFQPRYALADMWEHAVQGSGDHQIPVPWGTDTNPEWQRNSILRGVYEHVRAVEAKSDAQAATIDKLVDAVAGGTGQEIEDLKREIREAIESVTATVTLDVDEPA